jgi:Flp pilus assembly pilin Flp
MRPTAHSLKSWLRDEEGLETVEWILLLTVFVVPMIGVMMQIVSWLGYFYAVTSWVVSLPFP